MNFQTHDQETAFSLIYGKNAVVASGTATFAGVDIGAYIGDIKLIFTSTNPISDGSTGIQISILQSADNTTFETWAAAPTFALVTSTGGIATAQLDTRACKQYIQAKHVITGTTATFAFAVIGVGTKQVT